MLDEMSNGACCVECKNLGGVEMSFGACCVVECSRWGMTIPTAVAFSMWVVTARDRS